ncbi:hypothetical protein KFK09_007116 [Dendrobium nobile]|uniref:Uncharacterized protein n=1 Tax=Dendrobium nobile TaxID=94219 RepID=A0A8T3BR23_DENNO|nr:hypothetical protein KFK09_007116 [Dendrobium nobile]
MMDAPLAASAHKENVHNRGKATVLMKPDKLMPARNAGKERKALADLKNIYEPTFATSKDIDLKQKSAMKGNQAKSNAMTKVKERKAVPDLCSSMKPLVTDLSMGANPNTKSALLESLGKGYTPLGQVLTDEEIKRCYEWAKDGIEEMGGYSWPAKDETKLLLNQNLSEIMASAIGVPISELESPFQSDVESYETDESDLTSTQSFPDP